jgi:asparagine synthase (glutamine-hydrolysing)
MARHLGTHHQVVTFTPQDIGRVFPDVIWHTENADPAHLPRPYVPAFGSGASHHYKVVLTGEGADEFLGGYDIFKEMKNRRFVARHPESTLRPQLFSSLYRKFRGADGGGAFLSAYFSRDVLETASPYYSHALRWQNTARTQRFLAAPAQQAGWQAHLTGSIFKLVTAGAGAIPGNHYVHVALFAVFSRRPARNGAFS